MSHRLKNVSTWIEWSPSEVIAYSGGQEIGRAKDLAGLKGVNGRAVLALGRRSVFLKTARVPNAKAAELRQIIDLQAVQLFPAINEPLAHGFILSDDVNGEGRLAVLAAAPVSLLERLVAEAKQAGITVVGIVPLALGAKMVAKAAGVEEGAVASSTADGLAVDLVQNGIVVYSRVASVAGIGAVKQEIDRTLAAAGVGTLQAIGTPGVNVEGLNAPVSTLSALSLETDESNLLWLETPSAREAEAKHAVTTRSRFGMLMIVAALGASAIVYDARDVAQKEADRRKASYQGSLRQWTKLRDEAQKASSESGALKKELDRVFKPAQSAGDALQVAGDLVPNGVWLTGVGFERGKPLQLRGTATANDAVGAYLDALSEHPRFRDVRLVFANNAAIETTSVVQFSISAHVVGNLPAVASKKERRR